MSAFSTRQSKHDQVVPANISAQTFLTYDFAMLILTADFYRYTYTYQYFKFWHIKVINKKEKHKVCLQT